MNTVSHALSSPESLNIIKAEWDHFDRTEEKASIVSKEETGVSLEAIPENDLKKWQESGERWQREFRLWWRIKRVVPNVDIHLRIVQTLFLHLYSISLQNRRSDPKLSRVEQLIDFSMVSIHLSKRRHPLQFVPHLLCNSSRCNKILLLSHIFTSS